MANTADTIAVNGEAMTIAVQEKSMHLVSTLLESVVFLTAAGILMHAKPDDIYGMGDPKVRSIITGEEISKVEERNMEMFGLYSPLIDAVKQTNMKRMKYRDTNPTTCCGPTGAAATAQAGTTIAAVAWSPAPSLATSATLPTLTVTTDVNGTITTVAVTSAGSGYFLGENGAVGPLPTLEAVDATGSGGYGAQLEAVLNSTTGALSSVTVLNGGFNYAQSGIVILVEAGFTEDEKFVRPVFHYSKIKLEGRVMDNSVKAAKRALQMGTKEERDGAPMNIVGDAIKKKLGESAEIIGNDINQGTGPSVNTGLMSDNVTPYTFWDHQYGLTCSIDDGGTYQYYGGIDRQMAQNKFWRAKVDTGSHSFEFADAYDWATLQMGLEFKGSGPNLWLINPRLAAKWKRAAQAYTQRNEYDDDIREYAKYGFKLNAIQYGSALAIPDQRVPNGVAYAINPRALMIAFMTGEKFQPSPLWDQNRVNGGYEGSLFYLSTQWMFVNRAPALCAKFTNLKS
jgi:hypothetical protein